VLTFLSRHRWWFLATTIAAALLRLFFVLKLPVVDGDSLVYGQISKCLLNSQVLGLGSGSVCVPTLARLPGYPFFLAGTFLIFGQDHYFGAMLFQLVFDVLTCFVVADIARRLFSGRAACFAFLLTAFCPFLISYVATPLTECLEIFFTAAAVDCAVLALDSRLLRWWTLCGIACALAILLRADGGLLLGCIILPVLWLMIREATRRRELITATLLLVAVSLAPLAPWTIRNWSLFHVFQPLVTPQASDPGEYLTLGCDRWFDSWLIDYSSMVDIGFKVPGERVDVRDIPGRAYTSQAQRELVRSLFDQYNVEYDMTPELDRQFAAIAEENIRLHPIRYYLLLPAARTLDMWFRPRTQLLPLETHFWKVRGDLHDALCNFALMVLNFAYIAGAVAGAWLLRHRIKHLSLLLTYPVMRSLFLATTGMTEDRYTLECFPFVLVLAGCYLAWWESRRQPASAPSQAG